MAACDVALNTQPPLGGMLRLGKIWDLRSSPSSNHDPSLLQGCDSALVKKSAGPPPDSQEGTWTFLYDRRFLEAQSARAAAFSRGGLFSWLSPIVQEFDCHAHIVARRSTTYLLATSQSNLNKFPVKSSCCCWWFCPWEGGRHTKVEVTTKD
jgi:hypothetical protein